MAGVDEALDRCTNYFIDIIKPYESYVTLYVAKPIFFTCLFHTPPNPYKGYILAGLFFEKFLRHYTAGDRGSPYYVLSIVALFFDLITQPFLNILSFGFLFSDNEIFSISLGLSSYFISQYHSPHAAATSLIIYTALNDAALYTLYMSVECPDSARQLTAHIHTHTLVKKTNQLYTNLTTYLYLCMLWWMGQQHENNQAYPE